MAFNLADVAAIDMDTDGHLARQGVPDLVHIAYARRDGFHVTGQHVNLKTGRHPAAIRHAAVWLTGFAAAQHAYQAPDGVIMDGRGLARTPDKADH